MRSLKPKGGVPINNQLPSQGQVAKPTKSRDGCRRCKLRRRKCGEEKPECKRCVNDRVACPGYAKDFRWSSKYELLQSVSTPASASNASQAPPPADTQPPVALLPASEQPVEPVVQHQDLRASLERLYNPYNSSTPTEPPDFEPNLTFDASDQAYEGSVDDQPPQELILPFASSHEDDQEYEDVEEVYHTDMPTLSLSRRQRHASSSSSHAPEDLLRWYYRMAPSQYSDSDLVEHYFSQVCRLYALFDSTKNPFRALVGRNWDSSGSITLAIQSMSCAHLANSDSAMVRVGQNKQRQARISIHNDLQLWRAGRLSADRVLLAILLLGPTVSWHNAGDLGFDYLNFARELINAKLSQPISTTNTNNKALEQFFMHAMIYWEMMIAFVDSRDDAAPPDQAILEANLQQLNLGATASSIFFRETVKPHPWTGIAPHVQMLFAEVGRIMRRRVRSSQASFATQSEIQWAVTVEKALVAAMIPTVDDVSDSEDLNTPEDHFIQLAEAYRCAGLLQLYHVFPTVLAKRMLDSVLDGDAMSTDAQERYRINLALHTLGLVEALPISSGTSCLHPILVLTAGSELRFRSDTATPEIEDLNIDQRVAVGREFAEKRLSDLALRLPQQPFLRMLDIMKETWLQMDLFNLQVHWMQVMYERGWETIMG